MNGNRIRIQRIAFFETKEGTENQTSNFMSEKIRLIDGTELFFINVYMIEVVILLQSCQDQ